MKHLLYISILIALVISCKPKNERSCFKKTGNTSSIIHTNINAHKLEMHDDIALTLVQDSLDYIEIIGGENILPFVDMKLENGILIFKNKNTCNFTRKQEPLTVYYHCTTLESVQLNGYGKLSNINEFKSDIAISSYESFSSIELNLNNEYTTIHGQVGSIDALLSGKCDHLYMYSNGSGFMDASQLDCKTSHGHSQGIGDFSLKASQIINIELKSSGNFTIVESQNALKLITDEGEGEIYYQ